MPAAVLLLEPRGARLRLAPFVVLGVVVAAHLGWALLTNPFTVIVHPHAIVYGTVVPDGDLWAVPYVVAVIGPGMLSGHRSLVAFGWLNLAGLTVVAFVYVEAFVSLWCVFAACMSGLVVLHMVRRRQLPDAHRLHGVPMEA